MPMGGAWKESTSNGPRPPNRRAVAPPLALFVPFFSCGFAFQIQSRRRVSGKEY